MALNYLDNLGITRLREVGKILQIPRYSTFKTPDELRAHIRSFLDEQSRVRRDHLERIGKTQGQIRRLTAHIRELVEKRFGKGPEIRQALVEVKEAQGLGACLPDETVALLRDVSSQGDQDLRAMVTELVGRNRALEQARDLREREIQAAEAELMVYLRRVTEENKQYQQQVATLSAAVEQHVHDKAVVDARVSALQAQLEQVVGLPDQETTRLQKELRESQEQLSAARGALRQLKGELDAKTRQLARTREPGLAEEVKTLKAQKEEQDRVCTYQLRRYSSVVQLLEKKVEKLQQAGEASEVEITSLKAQLAEAARLAGVELEKKNQLKETRLQLIAERDELFRKKEDLKQVREQLIAERDQWYEEVERLRHVDSLRDPEFQRANESYAEQFNRAEALEAKLADMTLRYEQVQEELRAAGANRGPLESERDDLRTRLQECQNLRQTQQRELEQIRQQAARVQPLLEEVAKLKATLGERDNVIGLVTQRLRESAAKMPETKRMLDEIQASKQATELRLNQVQEQHRLCESKLSAALQEVQECHTAEGKLRISLAESEKLRSQYEAELNRVRRLYERARNAPARVVANFRKQLEGATQKYDQCVQTGKQLKQAYDELKASTSSLRFAHDEREKTVLEFQRLYNQCGVDLAKLRKEAPLEIASCIQKGKELNIRYKQCLEGRNGDAATISQQATRIKELEKQLLQFMRTL